jgi:hypothetical protein
MKAHIVRTTERNDQCFSFDGATSERIAPGAIDAPDAVHCLQVSGISRKARPHRADVEVTEVP